MRDLFEEQGTNEQKRSRAVHLAVRFVFAAVALGTTSIFFGHGHGMGMRFALMLIPATVGCVLLAIGCVIAAAVYDTSF